MTLDSGLSLIVFFFWKNEALHGILEKSSTRMAIPFWGRLYILHEDSMNKPVREFQSQIAQNFTLKIREFIQE